MYNTLNELVAMGEVLEVPAANGAKRYDPNAHRPHHHLVCTACGELWDVFAADPGRPRLSEEEQRGFRITGVEVVYRGLCAGCQPESAGEMI